MTERGTASRRLTDDQLRELLVLIDESDSVELKLTVSESDRRSALSALDLDPLDAQVRQVFFFDTPELLLDARGIVVRARRIQGKGDDSVVKLRPVVPHELPAGVRGSSNVTIEVDALPGGYTCSASMRAVPKADVRRTAQGGGPPRKLFSKEQRRFLASHAPEGVTLDDLSILGPINVFKLKFNPAGYRRRMVAELWMYPDDTRILELSTKCLPADAVRVAVDTRLFLTDRGVDLSGEQQTKTKTALDYFSRKLAANR